MFSPVPEFIAAVMPTTRRSRRTSSTIACPNTVVYCGGLAPADFAAVTGAPLAIDLGFAACHFSMPSRPPSSAGANPLPLTVAMCTTTGRSAASALRSARRRARVSCPSMTPMYAQSSSSQKSPGAHSALIDSFSCGPRRSNFEPIPIGSSVSRCSALSRACQSFGFRRTRLK
jgi:hypothetical protein